MRNSAAATGWFQKKPADSEEGAKFVGGKPHEKILNYLQEASQDARLAKRKPSELKDIPDLVSVPTGEKSLFRKPPENTTLYYQVSRYALEEMGEKTPSLDYPVAVFDSVYHMDHRTAGKSPNTAEEIGCLAKVTHKYLLRYQPIILGILKFRFDEYVLIYVLMFHPRRFSASSPTWTTTPSSCFAPSPRSRALDRHCWTMDATTWLVTSGSR